MSYLFLEVCLILFLGCLCKPLPVKINDICQKSDLERLSSNYIFNASVPKGGFKSGKYVKYDHVNESSCFKKCCNNTKCDVALHYGRICITFECDWQKSDLCRPVKAKSSKFQTSKFFLLRSPLINVPSSEFTISKRTYDETTTAVHTTIATPIMRVIHVSISENQTLVMPVNSVTLRANVPDDKGSVFEYQWSLLSKPSDKNSGKMDTTKTKELKLTDLIVGIYQFQVDVRGNNSYGKASVFVFVLPAKKKNTPPIAKIVPSNQTVQLPNNVILDGSKSTDDSSIVSYFWELIKGPLEADKKIKNDQSMLILENLAAGTYTFKLTVKDATGASSSDTAYIVVLAEKDYPPQADPGPNIIVELPVKYVILNGSASRDDKKIVSYQWTKKSDGLTADIQGVREPILNLTNLQEGTYTFNLKVTDASGQFSDKDVQVFVKPRTNSRPTSKASISEDKSVTVRLPATEAVLNGSLSSDDEKITEYHWEQIEGLPKLNLVDGNKPVAYIYDLKIGVFKFNLTVYDKERLFSSDVVVLRINESKNQKPQARVSQIPKYYHLETNLFRIDGSKSWDDVQIVRFKWTREDDSLAVGQVLDDSDVSPVLMLTDLLPGIYKFKLKVVDSEGLSDNIVSIVEILPSKYERSLVELQFICQLHLFTESKKKAFLSNIRLIIQKYLDVDTSKIVIHLVQLDKVPFKNSVTILFYVTLNRNTQPTFTKILEKQNIKNLSTTSYQKVQETAMKKNMVEEVNIDALKIVDALSIVRHNFLSMEYQMVRVETYVCQNNCSNHGKCNEMTKLCECDTFWTSSFLRDRFGDGRPNCDWSIIYLIIFFGFLFFALVMTSWFLLWLRKRRCKSSKPMKVRKHKYTKLNEYDFESRSTSNTKLSKLHSNGIKCRVSTEKVSESLGSSDCTLSSEEETTLMIKHHGDENFPVKRSSSFSSIPTSNNNPMKTL